MKKLGLVLIMLSIVLVCFQQVEAEKYEPTWESLSQWEVPQWFNDAVLGIYCHWGEFIRYRSSLSIRVLNGW